MPKNYYIILGIPANSSQEDIKAAYRRLAKEYHPDYFGESNAPFLVLQEAYSVLSDPLQRKTYDDSLAESRARRVRQNKGGPEREYATQDAEPLIPERGPVNLGNASLQRSFHTFRPSFNDLFDRIFGNFREQLHPKGEKLEELTVVIPLTPTQAFQGGHVRLYVPARMRCPECGSHGGTGFYECWRCGGHGVLTGEHPILISYPPGISDNHSVQLSLDRYGIHNLYLTVTFRISEMV